MTEGLRVMIYDTSDTKTVARWIKEATPNMLDFVDDAVDKLDIELGLTHSWWAGGWLFRQLRRFDHVKGFSNWKEALTWLAEVGGDQPIAEVQAWTHGSPGKAWMAGEILHARSFDHATNGPLLQKLKARLTPESLIWFRTCATFCGDRGHAFAKSWANNMGCVIAAHTHNIAFYHSGLYTIRPGQTPSWPTSEGILEGTPDRPVKLDWSGKRKPNSIVFLRSSVPEGW